MAYFNGESWGWDLKGKAARPYKQGLKFRSSLVKIVLLKQDGSGFFDSYCFTKWAQLADWCFFSFPLKNGAKEIPNLSRLSGSIKQMCHKVFLVKET